MHTTESKVGTNLSNLIETSLERGSDIFSQATKTSGEMKGLILKRLKLKKMWSTVSYCKWTKGLIGKLIWKLNLPNSNMTRHLFINWKVLIEQRFLLEFTGGRKVLTIHEFSSDDLMDTRDPPFSSHIFYIKSKIIIIN